MGFVKFCNDLDENKILLIKAIDIAKNKIQTLLEIKDKNYNNFIKHFFQNSLDIEKHYTTLSHLNSVANSGKSQNIYSKIMPLVDEYMIDLSTNIDIFNAFVFVEENDKTINKLQEKVLKEEIKDFLLSGINLPKTKKDELKKIQIRLSELSKDFSQNLIDANNDYELLIEDENAVKEIPKIDLEQSKVVKENKTYYKFTLAMPSYMAYMTYGSSQIHREELYKAYTSRAPQNTGLIDEILDLRSKKSKILGFENYADYSISFKDANSVDEIEDFLVKIAKISSIQAKKELKELEDFSKTKINTYDIAYYSEKMKKKYHHIDEEEYMNYFEQTNVVSYVLRFLEDSFDVNIKENTKTNTWGDKVKVYDFYTNDTKECFGRIYLDLENNEHKKGGAWMCDFETHFIDDKNKKHLSSAFVVCNFMPSSKKNPSLLKHSDIVTLFHELGHATHHIFSNVDEISLSGVNGVSWDVIEFPSQFLEQFAYDKNVLKSMGKHYIKNTPLSSDMIDKLINAKNFQAGLGMARQCEFALFDLLLHKKLYQKQEVQDLLDSVREKYSSLMPPKYNKFQNGFSHIFAGGYACGYYSYKWAEVLSASLYIHHISTPILKKYKENILQKGASENMGILLENIIGKKASTNDLFTLYNIKEEE